MTEIMDFSTLLAYIVKELNENRIGFGKTKILKIAYLVELDFYRNCRKRLTSEQWVYYKYGPYIFDYDQILENKILFTVDDNSNDFTSVKLNNWIDLPEISSDIHRLIKHNIKNYGDWSINKLLDHLYFNTEPMIKALERGEVLDFSISEPIENFKIKQLKFDKFKQKDSLRELRNRIKNARRL